MKIPPHVFGKQLQRLSGTRSTVLQLTLHAWGAGTACGAAAMVRNVTNMGVERPTLEVIGATPFLSKVRDATHIRLYLIVPGRSWTALQKFKLYFH